MKKTLLIIGIILGIIALCALAYGALSWFAFKNTLDASNSFYEKKHSMAITYSLVGVGLSILSVICFWFRR